MELFIERIKKGLIILSIFIIVFGIILCLSPDLAYLIWKAESVSENIFLTSIIFLLNNLLFFIYWCFNIVYTKVYLKKSSKLLRYISIAAFVTNVFLCFYCYYEGM
ncbi:hypothetical protein CLROS_043520 [Clostridium felsineum]|uniref:Uncharacterized protein n=1 Tax=Clostridium felsineum TaxID=36839 RepID=A0A1S8L3I0_9CLOT|nr:hypothetical protein CLROS_043520 [Clostridium felsineum]URZ09576.1 hypothetical protein CROST_002570 [Clostridium felsineum]